MDSALLRPVIDPAGRRRITADDPAASGGALLP
jgi:hypothetical protein